MPEFRLPSITGTVVDSSELLGQGPLVISSYRGGWCPYCNIGQWRRLASGVG